ncbi:MAG: winged helix-turn-helix domain-containing protein [Rhodospirillales bacterium]|nr:winged helix-turn-helix domain-containing protein [Rhodospirillales bacterium]
MTSPLVVSNVEARNYFIACQGLGAAPVGKLSPDGLLALIRTLGFVQIDSINTVARAHDMILFARNQSYRPHQLKHLLESERSLFEHWTHDAAVIPTEFYPYWRHRFARQQRHLLERWRKWRGAGFEQALEGILDKVSEQGPTRTRDIKSSRVKKGDGWWDWHPEKTALEFHWHTGTLAIAGRDGFQKIYDLSENVIPAHHRTAEVSESRFIDWACRSALRRLGMATSGEIAAFWALITPKEAAAWVRDRRAAADLVDIWVEPATGGQATKAVAFTGISDELARLVDPPKRLRVLSPFDPLIRDRKRCLRLFGFDYRIEVFVPKEKRKYGEPLA